MTGRRVRGAVARLPACWGQRRSPALAGMTGAVRAWTVLMISVVVDALQVGARDPEVGVPKLALDDRRAGFPRVPFRQRGRAVVVRRETSGGPRPAPPSAAVAAGTGCGQDRPRVAPTRTHKNGPMGSSRRAC